MKRKKCECGCGDLAKLGNRFIVGHNARGKKLSLETKRKISIVMKVKSGHKQTDETREKISIGQKGHLVTEETKKKISKGNKGKSHVVTEETKEKLSEAGKGHIVSVKTKEKISKALTGRTISEETKEKISKANKGRTHTASEETRRKISDANKKNDTKFGKEWDKYHPYMAPYQYRQLQDKIKKRDHYRCVLCNKNKRLNTHHIVPVKVGYRSRLCDHESNLITLCISCHRRVEPGRDSKDKWKEFLPLAKEFLSKFSYKKLLLSEY